MAEIGKIGVAGRVMAFVCRICPLCIPARRWPNSRYAHRIRVIQNECPFCQARIRLHRIQHAVTASAPATAATGA